MPAEHPSPEMLAKANTMRTEDGELLLKPWQVVPVALALDAARREEHGIMSELFTDEEVREYFRSEVAEAGGAKKWLRKHKLNPIFYKSCLHMIEDGSAHTLYEFPTILGFRKVIRYEATKPIIRNRGETDGR